MMQCLEQLEEVNQAQVDELIRVSKEHPNPRVYEDCAAFSKQVRMVESFITTTYALTARMTRKSDDLEEISDAWKRMEGMCSRALEVLAKLKHQYPDCGTPELYDLVLDYKNASSDRHKGVQEEIACQDQELPDHLFQTQI
jgi:hypothetical protein